MTAARQALGRRAEGLVAARLTGEGWRVLARNARVGGLRGELDLVALDEAELVFVEVKARRAGSELGPETPALAVGARKQAKLRALAVAWLGEHRGELPPNDGLRFDVVGMRLDAQGRVAEYEHLRAAF